ncbi:MAG TPA: DUF1080 domain-containing protein [archaeon]|nr:DUF1080 domain-containing protein [archaeon]
MCKIQNLSRAVLLVTVLFLCSCGKGSDSGFVPLFNGKDLSGWHVQGGEIESWQAENGVLSCIAPNGGWLSTDTEYADFILDLEWRIPENGNSGVGLRYPKDSHVSQSGMEIQILDDGAEIHKDIKPEQHTGSIYYQVAARQGAAKPPGEWNRYVITCNGPLVVVELNGIEVVRADMDQHTEGKGGLTPLSQRPRSGYIGLQSHDTGVDFRNIRIKVLN